MLDGGSHEVGHNDLLMFDCLNFEDIKKSLQQKELNRPSHNPLTLLFEKIIDTVQASMKFPWDVLMNKWNISIRCILMSVPRVDFSLLVQMYTILRYCRFSLPRKCVDVFSFFKDDCVWSIYSHSKMSALASRTVVQASAVRPSMRAVAPRAAASRRSLRVIAQAQNEKVTSWLLSNLWPIHSDRHY